MRLASSCTVRLSGMTTSRNTFCASIRCNCCFRRSFSRARRTDARLRTRSPASSSASMMLSLPDRRPAVSSRRPGSTRRTSTRGCRRDLPRASASSPSAFVRGRKPGVSASGFFCSSRPPRHPDRRRPAEASMLRFPAVPHRLAPDLAAPHARRRGREPYRPELRRAEQPRRRRHRSASRRRRLASSTGSAPKAASRGSSVTTAVAVEDAAAGTACRSSSALMASCRARTRVAFSWFVSPMAAPSRGLPSGRTIPPNRPPSRLSRPCCTSDIRPRASAAYVRFFRTSTVTIFERPCAKLCRTCPVSTVFLSSSFLGRLGWP